MAWNRVEADGDHFIEDASDLLARFEEEETTLVPVFNSYEPLIVVSDYGGMHKGSAASTYSYVVFQESSARSAIKALADFRCVHSGVGEVSYKNIRKHKKLLEALPDYVAAISEVPGVVLTFGFDKCLMPGVGSRDDSLLAQELTLFDPRVQGHVLAVTYLFAFIVAGVAAPGQKVHWVSDEDDMLANQRALNATVRIAYSFCACLTKRSIGGIRLTSLKGRPRAWVDLAAIPDLAAGSLARVINDAGHQLPVLTSDPATEGVPQTRDLVAAVLEHTSSRLRHWKLYSRGKPDGSGGHLFTTTRYRTYLAKPGSRPTMDSARPSFLPVPDGIIGAGP